MLDCSPEDAMQDSYKRFIYDLENDSVFDFLKHL